MLELVILLFGTREGLSSLFVSIFDSKMSKCRILILAKCRNPSADVEVSGGIPIDCVYKKCSPGYHCEYNNLYKGGQYICCGISPENPIYGKFSDDMD